MATTARQLISKSLRKLGVRSTQTSITDQELSDGIDDMNSMMRSLEARTIVLGYTPISTGDEEITVPDWAIEMMFTNLAIRISSDYGKLPSQALIAQTRDAYGAVLQYLKSAPEGKLPPDLPTGAGAAGMGSSQYGDRKFVGDQTSEDILTADGTGLMDGEDGQQLLQSISGDS